MNRFFSIAAIAAFTAGLAGTASAQIIGTYTGTTADGNGLTFIVDTDTNTGALALTSASIGFSAPCKGEAFTLNTGWGYGLTSDIVAHKVSVTTNDNYFYFVYSLKFSTDGQTATGTLEAISPTVYPVTGKPTKALFCTSPKQTLTLSYSSSSTTAKVPPQGHLLFDRVGRIIGHVSRP
jgi:hypothetical protein